MTKNFARGLAASLLLGTSTIAAAQTAPIIQPGAPGMENKTLAAEDATKLAATTYTPADARFMQMMIPHHRQAVAMTALVEGRTANEDIVAIAGRIDAGQADEIAFMREWLEARGERLEMMHHQAGMSHAEHMAAMGMATPEQVARLATLEGTAFDELFLELMIRHHQGAIDMVDDLLDQPGTAYDPVMFEFVNDIKTEQQGEIERMNAIAAGLSTDPRAGLAAGFRDAGEAISNLRLVTAMPKPTGFFDPANPAQLQPLIEKKEEKKADDESAEKPDAEEEPELVAATTPDPRADDEDDEDRFGQRGSLLSFANTDIAFSGDLMVAGNYHGWNAYRLGEDGVPELVTSVVCPGGQGDVSIVGDILIMSVQDSRARKDCGLQGVQGKVSEDRFRGLRIFDISDITNPRQVGLVQTCRGSHTHSVVNANDTRIIVYNSGTSYVRDDEELAGCFDTAGDDTALFSIDVVEIPLADPGASRVVDSPRVFAQDGQIAGLWRGGDHGEGTQKTNSTNHCHDITVFPSLNLAAGACSGNGIIMDISDPMKPVRIDDVTDKGFAYWHSATFNNDGTKVLFTDEWGGGGRPRCQAGDPMDWGANAFYSLRDGELTFDSLYKIPAPQSDKENCVAHNGSIIPVPGRDIFVQAWYQGGISVIDFTDAKNPIEIAYFDRGPVDKDQLITGGYWSAYWYKGRIYATEIARGLDVFALEPSEFLTAEETAAAEAAQFPGDVFNPQTQTQVTWPEDVVARVEQSRKGG
ncbi:DUF305 domain-containing protein [Erythrobacter litoralis]|uniref:Putative secreted protein n=1 Tax=Erythrobacter litoralis (strain HTCC2594) TaxID=314225 RepID=Q2N5S7_ERYLH|nr:DUF305 domain-containing protein [Erythrobacter litoralis]ABC64964.1 putative secreted protein [Erythrobacter litoralis HTCC2594]